MQDKNSPAGLEGPARRFVRFNGGVSDAQLSWLKQTLAEAAASEQRALVCCHLPLHPGGACCGTSAGMDVVHGGEQLVQSM